MPFAAGEPDWPRFDSESQQMLSLEPPRSRVKTDFAADHHCDFWAGIRNPFLGEHEAQSVSATLTAT